MLNRTYVMFIYTLVMLSHTYAMLIHTFVMFITSHASRHTLHAARFTPRASHLTPHTSKLLKGTWRRETRALRPALCTQLCVLRGTEHVSDLACLHRSSVRTRPTHMRRWLTAQCVGWRPTL